ncbi:hypothetical protein [Kitasatospora purpeofusca]|uniref:hypothetical protein n=1 Tax=Kitasatospora purpeofusca TaxID=67352 RepID=UPI003255E75A
MGPTCAHSRHLVTVHAVGRADLERLPVACLLRELLNGRSPDRLISDGLPDLGNVLTWAAQIGDALVAAHRARHLHRDIDDRDRAVGASEPPATWPVAGPP